MSSLSAARLRGRFPRVSLWGKRTMLSAIAENQFNRGSRKGAFCYLFIDGIGCGVGRRSVNFMAPLQYVNR